MNIWCAFDMDENIVTQKFLTQTFANEINANYGTNENNELKHTEYVLFR